MALQSLNSLCDSLWEWWKFPQSFNCNVTFKFCFGTSLRFVLINFIVLLQNKCTALWKWWKFHKDPTLNKCPPSRSKNLMSTQGGKSNKCQITRTIVSLFYHLPSSRAWLKLLSAWILSLILWLIRTKSGCSTAMGQMQSKKTKKINRNQSTE